MSASFVPRGEAEVSLRKLENADSLSGAKYRFLRFLDMFNAYSNGVLLYRSEIG
jgi:hypothetical protein